MKKFIAIFSSALLTASFVTPAALATGKYEVDQKTLATFSGNSTLLTEQQRAQVRATVEANPNAEKFICTGIRFHSQPMSVNIMVRKRAKAACDYAKELNPALSTWFQNKPTMARSLSGKVLLTVKSPTSSNVNEDALAETPIELSDPLDVCKLEEVSWARKNYREEDNHVWTGFPDLKPKTTRSGVVKWALIPIDFPDLRGQQNFRARVDDQMKLLSEWFEVVSGGRLKVEWVVADGWVTLPEKTSEYVIPLSVNLNNAANGPKLFVDAMNSADPSFDFSGIQTVNFILPKGQSFISEGSQGFPWDEAVRSYTSNEGKISSYSIPGAFFDLPGKTYWSYWAHEFGHAIGLPHVGASRGNLAPFNPWDLMGGQDGPSKELSGWLRFLAGWLDSDQVYCKDATKIRDLEIRLTPLSDDRSGTKFVVVPLSATKALLVESRRETKFSCKTSPSRDGVLVYVYDATLGHNEDFLIPISPGNRPNQADDCNSLSGRGTPTNPDYLLRTGDLVNVDGIQVKVLAHGALDKIRIQKTASPNTTTSRNSFAEDSRQLIGALFTNSRRGSENQHCSCCGCTPIE
jgi:M6 family metalloprotease-like protein